MKIISDKSLNKLYLSLVTKMKNCNLPVYIVGGHACIEYGLAEFTKDLDIVSSLNECEQVLEFLTECEVLGEKCRYRFGHGSPLARPWLDGGWSSHFIFPVGNDYYEPCIDIFGAPPRVVNKKYGHRIFASMEVVAEMKKTKRPRDWAFVSSLGLKMLNSGDISGLLYVYDEEKLKEAVGLFKPDGKLLNSRPVLRLALENSPLLSRAIKTEIDFWSVFDRKRLTVYKNAWEGYFKKVNNINLSKINNLVEEHNILLEHAVKNLSAFPLNDYGISRLFDESRTEAMTGILEEIEEYLPDTSELENYLERMKRNYEKIKTA
jgi:hypothetical protein